MMFYIVNKRVAGKEVRLLPLTTTFYPTVTSKIPLLSSREPIVRT